MPLLTFCGLIFWIFINILTFLFSGNIYYKINNYFIPTIPLLIFVFAFLIYFIIKIFFKVDYENIKINNYNLSKLLKFKKIILLTVHIQTFIIIIIMYYVTEKLNISLFEAQNLRDAYFSNLEILGGAGFIWFTWILEATLIYCVFCGIIFDVRNKKPFTKITIFSFINCFMWNTVSGGRIFLLGAILIYIGSWYLCGRSYYHSKKKRLKYVVFIPLFFSALFTVLQLNRSLGGEFSDDLGNYVIPKYFIGPLFALDQFLAQGIDINIYSELGRIGVSIIGLDTIFVSGLLRGILGVDIDSALAITSRFFHYGVPISNNVIMNAHYTAGGRFYIDFGLGGYIFVYSILALLCLNVDLKRKFNFGLFFPVYAGLVFLSLVYSSRELIIDSPSYLIAITSLFITYKYINKNQLNKKEILIDI